MIGRRGASLLRVLIGATLLQLQGFACAQASDAKASAAPQRVAVLYPRVRDPYRAVFRAIVDGINEELPNTTEVLEMAPEEDVASIAAQLAARNIGSAVLLGKRGLELSARLEEPQRLVVGAIFAQPDDISNGVHAISLAPAPRRLFEKLRELAPAVKRIHVIYGADSNRWLIELARVDAAALGYDFVALERDNIREGASTYRELLREMQSPTDAIWLLQASPFLDENSVLQMVLRAAWDRNLVVFSSNPSHVPKGALFALFPDNHAMGRYLGVVIAGRNGHNPALVPLEQLNTAINIRTADHLGLGLSAADARFDMVFPSR